MGGVEAEGGEEKPGARNGGGGAEGDDIEWADGDKKFGDEGGAREQR